MTVSNESSYRCVIIIMVSVFLFFRTAGDDVSNGKCCVSLRVFSHRHTHSEPNPTARVCVLQLQRVCTRRDTHTSVHVRTVSLTPPENTV